MIYLPSDGFDGIMIYSLMDELKRLEVHKLNLFCVSNLKQIRFTTNIRPYISGPMNESLSN